MYMTGVHWACKKDNMQIMKILEQYNPKLDCLDIIGRSPLYFAVQEDSAEMVQYLLLRQVSPWSEQEYLDLLELNNNNKNRSLISYLLNLARQTQICIHMINDVTLRDKTIQNHKKKLAENLSEINYKLSFI